MTNIKPINILKISWFRFLPFYLSMVLASEVSAQPDIPLRQVVNFNRDWKFQLGDPANAALTQFDDAK